MLEQLNRLKDLAPPTEVGPVGERLAKLQQDAGALANTTDTMYKALEGNTAKSLHHKSGFFKNNFFF